jgi:succinoglycan biosynthesis protein ExoM
MSRMSRLEAIGRPRVCICICTFKRPELLGRLLEQLAEQRTHGEFSCSIVVADNDQGESAKPIVSRFSSTCGVEVTYCVEPERNIALARNAALARATGDYLAFIDDDELPIQDWLVNLLRACHAYRADGVLGPVRPSFDQSAPTWLVRSGLCDRPEHPTGHVLEWRQTRTGNVMLRREILAGMAAPFHRTFGNGGEDQDFFRRMMRRGHRFVWCNEAVVYEAVPPARCTRRYVMKRALLRGQNEKSQLTIVSIAKSLVAAPLYVAALPVTLMRGQHVFMRYVVRLLDHLGKLAVALGFRPVGGRYLGE